MASKQINKLIEWKDFATKFQNKTYQFPKNKAINWFPGHMVKGLRQMQYTLLKTDCVIEVHDARIPLSGRNLTFRNNVTGNRPHILVLNKQDLAFGTPRNTIVHANEISKTKLDIKKKIMKKEPNLSDVIFCSCSDLNSGVKSVLPRAIELLKSSDRYHREMRPDSNIMIIGIPNVGKSTLINHIRKGSLRVKNNALRTGNKPGITRTLENKVKVSEEPLVYLLDTPGIMMPNIKDMHVGMKLAVCGTLKDEAIGEENIVDYLLFALNRAGNFNYLSYMGIENHGPQENSKLMLARSSFALGWTKDVPNIEKGGMVAVPQWERTAQRFLAGFRQGHFGKFILDQENLET